MPIIDLGQQRKIIGCVLIEDVVLDYDHLEFFHVESCVHLNGALVYEVDDLRLAALLRVLEITAVGECRLITLLARISRLGTLAGIRFLVFLCLLIFVEDGLEDLLGLLFALVKVVWVCAHDDYAKVDREIPDVDVQNELLRYSRDTNGRPSLATVFHARIGVYVVHEDLHVLGLDLCHLLGIRENTNRVHRADKHATGKSLG